MGGRDKDRALLHATYAALGPELWTRTCSRPGKQRKEMKPGARRVHGSQAGVREIQFLTLTLSLQVV